MQSSTVGKSGRLLARNAVWNIVGQLAPMLVAVFAIPRLIHGLGPARFGVLTIAWMVVGYFGFFDLGLGRALTKLVADKLGSQKEHELPQLVWSSIAAICLLGFVLTCVCCFPHSSRLYDPQSPGTCLRLETF